MPTSDAHKRPIHRNSLEAHLCIESLDLRVTLVEPVNHTSWLDAWGRGLVVLPEGKKRPKHGRCRTLEWQSETGVALFFQACSDPQRGRSSW
ncbi:hypothetical protein KSP39_PZI015467 [Platanthera zijinensis]|uniref:Uncharacterized protein n=1 Tax=Platanthera zijinensis TaxID=2320716 RepID=A0AAP0G1E0_9ASPA